MSNKPDTSRDSRIRARFQPVPTNEIPVFVPVQLVLARTDTVAVWLTGVNVYSTCLTFSVEASTTGIGLFLNMYGFGKPQPTHTPPMLIGFEDAEGTRATNLPGRRTGLRANGNSGSSRSSKIEFVLAPVPPAGPIQVHFSWPYFGIDEVEHTLDATDYASASGRVTTLWDEVDDPTAEVDIDDRTILDIEIPSGGWFATAFEMQKPPPPDPNAPRRINFAHVEPNRLNE